RTHEMENMKDYQINRTIFCIDLKSFYASVECVLRGLDPFNTPLVVADKGRGGGSIVLAVSPYLRKLGIPSRCRVFEIPENLDIIFAKPRMETYMEYSAKVIEVYLEFVSFDDLYVYSIDESLLDVTHYLKRYNLTARELAEKILNRIKEKLGLTATCGIGPNMLMSKLALDIESKKSPDFIGEWTYDDIPKNLWPVTPLSEMWGIGSRMEANLNDLGVYSIYDLAHFDVNYLKKLFGVIGEELYYHAHGIDMSLIQDKDKLRSKAKSFSANQVLFRDYTGEEILTIILEMVDEITRRLRMHRKKTRTIHLAIGYSKDFPGGFSRQITLDQPTHNETTIYQACLDLFERFYIGYPIRVVGISAGGLTDYDSYYQFSIFEDTQALEKEFKLK